MIVSHLHYCIPVSGSFPSDCVRVRMAIKVRDAVEIVKLVAAKNIRISLQMILLVSKRGGEITTRFNVTYAEHSRPSRLIHLRKSSFTG